MEEQEIGGGKVSTLLCYQFAFVTHDPFDIIHKRTPFIHQQMHYVSSGEVGH